MYFVYALYNYVAQKIYIGQTQDIAARVAAHNSKHKTKSFTARFKGEWKLIYEESLSTRSEAIKREKQLKTSGGREFIKSHIPG